MTAGSGQWEPDNEVKQMHAEEPNAHWVQDIARFFPLHPKRLRVLEILCASMNQAEGPLVHPIGYARVPQEAYLVQA